MPTREERAQRAQRLTELDDVEVEVEIDRLVQGGLGLAFWQGIPLLVEGAAPRERARVTLVRRHSDYGLMRVVEVVRAGPDRVEPPCPYYDSCGGCDLQHIRPEKQLDFKARAAFETLQRIGGLRELPAPLLVHGATLGYRSRAQLQTDWGPLGEPEVGDEEAAARRPRVGFRARSSTEVVDVERCLVLDETLQEALQQARGALSERAVQVQVERAQGDDRPALPRRIDLLAGDDGKWVAAPLLGELPRGDVKITVRAMGRPFTFGCDAHTFFQSNRVLCGRLVEVALSRHAEGNPASEDDVVHEVAWDLYSGVGLMALPLAHLAKRVIAVEGDRDAVRHLRRNSRKAAGKIEVVASDVESFLSAQAKSPSEEPEIVVIDPPRSGLSKRALRALMHLQPRSVRYVSCDPATLARDLRVFQERYRVERLAFVDMFAQTSHLESVVWLERED